jgi:hypothetical protein
MMYIRPGDVDLKCLDEDEAFRRRAETLGHQYECLEMA